MDEKCIENFEGEIHFQLRRLFVGQMKTSSPTIQQKNISTQIQAPLQQNTQSVIKNDPRWFGKLSISEGNTKIPICQIYATSLDMNKKSNEMNLWPTEILIENKLPKLKPTINAIISEEVNLPMFQFTPAFSNEDNQKRNQYKTILQKMNEKDLVSLIFIYSIVFTCHFKR